MSFYSAHMWLHFYHCIMDLTIASKNVSRVSSRLDELKNIFLLCIIFIMCTWDFCFIKPCQCFFYHLVDTSIIFSGKITSNVKICRDKNVKLTNWRHPYFSQFCLMVWGAGKFVVKTARVYRVNSRITDLVEKVIFLGLLHNVQAHWWCKDPHSM